MRILLAKGKQKWLILLAKQKDSWQIFSKKISISDRYLRNDLIQEKRTLDEEKYHLLCNLAGINFDKYILKKMDDDWGRSKGGINSPKNKKVIKIPEENEDLAEVIGIILGDGHVEEFIKDKKIRCYGIKIAGNAYDDKDYITNYIPSLFFRVFKEKGTISLCRNSKAGYYKLYGKEFVEFLKSKGINSGNKLKNNQGIPNWIKINKKFMINCLRGLIDTDGSVHLISKNNKNLRINYTSYIPKLLNDVRQGLIDLGYSPSKIINNRQIFLTSKKDVETYIKNIGFSNQKNLNRIKMLGKDNALVV